MKIKDITHKGEPKPKKPTKPTAKGAIHVIEPAQKPLPSAGTVKRYILTSAQNNTHVHAGVWKNILALAKYYHAEIFVGEFTYDQNSYGPMSVKPGTYKGGDRVLWYDPWLKDYTNNHRVQLGKGLVWCGDTNILPTAGDPLSGFETFAGRQSAVFPHAKIAMRSVASVQGSGAKLIYTTGTVTQRNYIVKKAGLIADFHHTYGGLLAEVDSQGRWKVRQLDAEDESGTIYDLTLKVEGGVVTEGHRVEAITWGDIHATIIDKTVLALSATSEGNMLDVLEPRYQFIHDLIEGASVNHHAAYQPLERFKSRVLRGLDVLSEMKASADILRLYYRPSTNMVVVNSNHDRWLDRWLDEYRPQRDNPQDLELYYAAGGKRLEAARAGSDLNVLEYLIRQHAHFDLEAKFLALDESFLICDRKIECGQHGDLGANGAKGSPAGLSKTGRRSNIGHTHSAGIWDGLYVAGTSTEFRMGYNHGSSSWTHSHIITYANGKRAIITMFEEDWRAK